MTIRRRLDGARRRDSGSGALEFAILSVAFLTLVFLIVQAALYYHSRNVVQGIAEGTARAVRAYPAAAGAQAFDTVPSSAVIGDRAQVEARRQWQILDNEGDTTAMTRVTGRLVNFDQIEVTVTAKPILLLPGLFGSDGLQITASAGGPVEVFKRSGDD